jgi:hypothetical protein
VAANDLNNLIKKTKVLNLRDKVIRRVLQTVHVMTDQRIFRDGIDANGKLIGTYSASYQKTRRRKNYPISKKVILQATSQMVNDYKFLVLADGNYGSGFSNTKNFDKSFWVEDTYDKSIFELTDSEDKKMEVLLEREMSKFLSKL